MRDMSSTKLFSAITLLILLASCGGGKQQSSDDIITMDVTANYPKKELILQDFMDVEYVPLETTDEFVTQSYVQDIGKKYIILTNYSSDGDIFIYDREGKAIRKINRKGQSGEEYSSFIEVILDEEHEELFVMDLFTSKFFVYDLEGQFKRKFESAKPCIYSNIFNYDKNNLIAYKNLSPDMESIESDHLIISKKDGEITQTIAIPYEGIVSTVVNSPERTIMRYSTLTIPHNNNWVVTRSSADTIYKYIPEDDSLVPLIARTPPIHTMDSHTFLFPVAITDRYYFVEVVKKEPESKTGYYVTPLVYDKQEKAIYNYTLYNDDFTNKVEVSHNINFASNEIAKVAKLEAFDIVEAYNNGELKGRLKEIATTLNEDDNAVLMLIKPKG